MRSRQSRKTYFCGSHRLSPFLRFKVDALVLPQKGSVKARRGFHVRAGSTRLTLRRFNFREAARNKETTTPSRQNILVFHSLVAIIKTKAIPRVACRFLQNAKKTTTTTTTNLPRLCIVAHFLFFFLLYSRTKREKLNKSKKKSCRYLSSPLMQGCP